MPRIGLWIEALARALARAGALFGFLIFLTVASDVIGRELLGFSTRHAVDLSELFMFPLVFLTAPFVAQVGANVRIDLFVHRAGSNARRGADVFALAGLLGLASLITWRGLEVLFDAVRFGSMTENAAIPKWPFLSAIPIGGLLLVLQLLVILARVLRGGLMPGEHELAERMPADKDLSR